MTSLGPSPTRNLLQCLGRHRLQRTQLQGHRFSTAAVLSAGQQQRVVNPARRARNPSDTKRLKRVSSSSNSNSNSQPPSTSNPLRFSIEDALPPRIFLASAYKSGVIQLEPDAALQVLRNYAALYFNGPKGWEANFLKDYDIDPSTLHLLARILNRVQNTPGRMLAKMMIHSASSLGCAPATIELLRGVLKKGDLSRAEYREPLKRLDQLAKEGNLAAMVLLGRIYEMQRREEEALKMFDTVTRGRPKDGMENLPPEVLSREEEREGTLSGYEVPEALVASGTIRLRQGKPDVALGAIRRAALEEDYPLAYYKLALLTEDEKVREEYFLKAAESGIVEACHELGVSILKRGSTLQGRSEMAKEWLYISASGGIRESALALGVRFEEEKNEIKAREWFKLAEGMLDTHDRAKLSTA